MRVLTVTNLYPTPSEPWFGSFVKDQVDAVRRLGVSVDVFQFDGRRDWRAYGTAARAVRRLVADEDYDIVHAQYGLSGAVALSQCAVPVVTTFHGSDSAQIPWQRRVSWVVARRSTPIFVAAENARRLGLPEALVLPAGVDTALFQPADRADARAALGWERDATYILLPGARSNPVKRADLFDRVLDLVAHSVDNVRGVSLEGYSRHDVANVMNAVDVVLLTSDSEGSPVAVKEALASGTPVVSVPVGDVSEMLAGLPGCAVLPRDPHALAGAVLDALTVRDPALRGRALEFSHDRVAQQLVRVYDSVLEGRPRRRLRATRAMTSPARPRRLCMVVHGPYPEPRVARESAAALDAGYEVEIIATKRKGEAPHEVVDGATVTRLPVNHVQGAGMARILGEYLAFTTLAAGAVGTRAVSRRYDVVHVHAPPDFLIASALIPRLFGSRVILDIHDRSPDMFSMRFPGRLGLPAKTLLQHLERLAARCADVVLTVHDPYVRELVALGTPAEKTAVVMNSLDEHLLPTPKPPTQGPFRIVYHGTLTPHYGVHLLLDAVALIVEHGLDARVEIIGEGDSLPDLQARTAALGLSDRVAIEGRFLPHRTVLERVNGASVGVVPNLPIPLNRFALSSKLFEYVVLGVPVVSAALPTIQEYFSDQEVGFFEPGNAKSLADALLAVARDPDAASLRAERARRRYASYRWDLNRLRYVGILDRLTTRSRRAEPVGVRRS